MADRYRLRLHLSDGDVWDVSVDNANRWELPTEPFETEELRSMAAESIAMSVNASLIANPPGYVPVWAMRYAIQALIAFPGSEPLFEIPLIDNPMVQH